MTRGIIPAVALERRQLQSLLDVDSRVRLPWIIQWLVQTLRAGALIFYGTSVIQCVLLGCAVVLACRSLPRGERLKANIQQQAIDAGVGSPDIQVMELDLASLDSVRKFCDMWEQDGSSIDVLVNNAGIFSMGGASLPPQRLPHLTAAPPTGAFICTHTGAHVCTHHSCCAMA